MQALLLSVSLFYFLSLSIMTEANPSDSENSPSVPKLSYYRVRRPPYNPPVTLIGMPTATGLAVSWAPVNSAAPLKPIHSDDHPELVQGIGAVTRGGTHTTTSPQRCLLMALVLLPTCRRGWWPPQGPPAAKKPQKKLDNAITGYDQDNPDRLRSRQPRHRR